MEKQPIDDFFARKLREAEQLPSPAAFSRLQSKMASAELPRKRNYTAIWWYSAAASLLIITVFVYRGNVNTLIGTTEGVAKLDKIEKTRVDGPVQKAGQLIAREGKRPSLQPEKVAEGNKPNSQQAYTLAKQPTNQHQVVATTAVVRKLPESKPEIQQKPVLLPPVLVEQVAVAIAPKLPLPAHTILPAGPVTVKAASLQRVVVLTIDVPAVETPIVALQATGVESTSQVQPGSLAGLFAKVKQLKNGDVLARATPAKRLVESRSRLGRVFEGMKESLKNETNLE